jgi:Holliday junction resolvasome RuvABC endonuclease subunit
MNIYGLDLSPTSPGATKFILDDNLDVVSVDRLGFQKVSQKKFKETPPRNIHYYVHEDMTQYERFNYILDKLEAFVEHPSYVAIEDYAFGASGDITQIAEFGGNIKLRLFNSGASIRLYDPNTIKYLATGKGNIHKPEMYDSYISGDWKTEKYDISDLPEIPSPKKGANVGVRNKGGVSPTSDLIDSWFICKTLQFELKLRMGLLDLKSLSEQHIKVFNRTTPTMPENILSRDFMVGKIK